MLEALEMLVWELDFGRDRINVQQGKGRKNRVTMLPGKLLKEMLYHQRHSPQQYEINLKCGLGQAAPPNALSRNHANADQEWVWQWVFPASSYYLDRETVIRHRHHLPESVIQKAVHQVGQWATLGKRVTTHGSWHSFATHPLEDGHDIRTVRELSEQKVVQITMVCTHVLNRCDQVVRCPLDVLEKAVSSEVGRRIGRPKTGWRVLRDVRFDYQHDGCRAAAGILVLGRPSSVLDKSA